jgi:hypothetical protein
MFQRTGNYFYTSAPTPEGKKELVGFQTGVRESAQSGRELLIESIGVGSRSRRIWLPWTARSLLEDHR